MQEIRQLLYKVDFYHDYVLLRHKSSQYFENSMHCCILVPCATILDFVTSQGYPIVTEQKCYFCLILVNPLMLQV